MNSKTISALQNIYISPLELCNLNCRFCYTKKTKNILTNSQIISFVRKYSNHLQLSGLQGLKSIIFCGGEVFTLPDFPVLVNKLVKQGIFITIITNGTLNRLSEINDPSNCQIIVSFDGPLAIHDANRGSGNFNKSLDFTKHAQKLGFPVSLFFLITKDSYPYKDSFDILGLPKTYLTDRLFSLTKPQLLDIKSNYPTFPSKNFGCFHLALQSDGLIYGCCESAVPLAKITDSGQKIVSRFISSLSSCQNCKFTSLRSASGGEAISTNHSLCGGCCCPDFLCNYKKELSALSCKDVFKLFNEHQK